MNFIYDEIFNIILITYIIGMVVGYLIAKGNKKNKVYSVKFNGYTPVGAVALIVAKSKDEALLMINSRLYQMNLGMVTIDNIYEESTSNPRVKILLDGDY